MVDCIIQELIQRKNYLEGEQVNTIYFGGGTPSLLNGYQLNKIMETLNSHYKLNSDEITLEANPEDLTPQKLEEFFIAGINRLSIGIQSFQNIILKKANRNHDSHTATTAVLRAYDSGIENISIDLIYGFHDSTIETWKSDINQALKLPINHISSYNLTIEEKTVFGKLNKSNKLPDVDENLSVDQYHLLVNTLKNNGFFQYEISNFSKTGYEAIHNTNYWKREKYLGIGPSAHSYNGSIRSFNINNNVKYMTGIESKNPIFSFERLLKSELINEYILTGLRTKWGINFDVLKKDFKYDLYLQQANTIESFVTKNLLIISDQNVCLTDEGKLFADMIASELFIN